ncbi:unnamed protein product, partial [marine sediment metagenome]
MNYTIYNNTLETSNKKIINNSWLGLIVVVFFIICVCGFPSQKVKSNIKP